MGSVILLMLGVGMGMPFGQLLDAFKQFGIVLKGVLANFLIAPVIICFLLMALPLSTEIKIGIMLIATSSFPDSVVGPVTLVFSVFTMVFAVLYGKLKLARQLRH